MHLGYNEEVTLQGLVRHCDSCMFNCKDKTIQVANKQNQRPNECQFVAGICLPQLEQQRCKCEIQPEL